MVLALYSPQSLMCVPLSKKKIKPNLFFFYLFILISFSFFLSALLLILPVHISISFTLFFKPVYSFVSLFQSVHIHHFVLQWFYYSFSPKLIISVGILYVCSYLYLYQLYHLLLSGSNSIGYGGSLWAKSN